MTASAKLEDFILYGSAGRAESGEGGHGGPSDRTASGAVRGHGPADGRRGGGRRDVGR